MATVKEVMVTRIAELKAEVTRLRQQNRIDGA